MTLTAAGRRLKGDRAEREVLTFLRDQLGEHLTRARGEGNNDHGDIAGLPSCVVQVKNYADPLRAIRDGLDGARAQRDNAGLLWGAAFIRRRGGAYMVVMDPSDWVSMYREAVLARAVVAAIERTPANEYKGANGG